MTNSPVDTNRFLRFRSALGDDLICNRFAGNEKLGCLFDYQLGLLSGDPDIDFNRIVGTDVTVSLELPDAATRYFHGYITEFRFLGLSEGFFRYQATMKPWLWFLSRTADCRIFQNQSVPDIIKSVFRDNEMDDFEDKLGSSYREWVYCVQYRETDLNFISRLMEQEGIYYYFKHEASKHTLVLADSMGGHETFPGYATVPFFPPDEQAARERDHIQDWVLTQGIVPSKLVLKDFDFEKPKIDLITDIQDMSRDHPSPMDTDEIFDYPGEYVELNDGNTNSRIRLEELQAQFERVQAGGDAKGMCSGYLFTLEGHPRENQNQEHLIIAVTHDIKCDAVETISAAVAEDHYFCQLELMLKTEQYRSGRITPKPLVQGLQTATVVGPSGEEIHCDEHGRVKIQFHWDRQGQHDQNSSCWVRVSQAWAGNQWGSIHIPRIDQEVLVSFLEGDPDRPLITGRVYNAVNKPPYTLEENKTQSGIKSRSSKRGQADNFNELRFEDKIGEEEFFYQAEKDMNGLVKNNRKIEILGRDILEVSASGIDSGLKVTVFSGDHEQEVESGNKSTVVSQGDISCQAESGKIEVEGAVSMELKVGASSIKLEPAQITITSPQIMIQADAMATLDGGGICEVKASGVTMVTGGVVKIN